VKTLGGRVRVAREKLNIGSGDLDKLAKLTAGHVAVIESRGDAAVALDTAVKLAKALGVSLDWLLTGAGEGPKPAADPAPARAAGGAR
jgi:ribosome-binding protein aMBF1 (putative translation factor)